MAVVAKSKSPFVDKLEIHSPAEIERLNLLVYGEPGVGKTWLTGTATDSPLTGPLLLLDVEGGSTTLRKKKDIDVVQVRSLDQLVQVHQMLLEENNGYYKTVALDSLTELQKLDMREIMREVVNKDPDRNPDVPSQREWGITGEHMRKIVRGFRDLPMNTIFTALMVVEKDENSTMTYYPSMPGKMRVELSGFMDIVGYLHAVVEEGESVRKLQVAKTRRIIAKDRTDSLGGILESPTIPMMWDLIKES